MRPPYDADRTEEMARELAACRQRGVEGLDRSTHNQAPIPLPDLERLAEGYAVASAKELPRRKDKIKELLREALSSFDRSDPNEARLIRDLLFGPDTHTVSKGPAELLRLPATLMVSLTRPGSARYAIWPCASSPGFSSDLPKGRI